MKTLCMDSAHKYLTLVLLENGEVKASISYICWKKQSEAFFPELINLMNTIGWNSDDLDEVVISDGPGSYTGVRIAMSIAKVLCTMKNLPLYCLSTLQLYAGIHKDTFVVLDARSQRVYCALLDQGIFKTEEMILTIEEAIDMIKGKDVRICGDTDVIELNSENVDFVQNFKALRPFARYVENIHALTPRYLKEQDAYKVKK